MRVTTHNPRNIVWQLCQALAGPLFCSAAILLVLQSIDWLFPTWDWTERLPGLTGALLTLPPVIYGYLIWNRNRSSRYGIAFFVLATSWAFRSVLNFFIVFHHYQFQQISSINSGAGATGANMLALVYPSIDLIGWVLLFLEIPHLNRVKTLWLTTTPILLTVLFSLSFVGFSYAWYAMDDRLILNEFIQAQFQISLFLMIILCFSCAKSETFGFMSMGYLFVISAFFFIDYHAWNKIYYALSFQNALWIFGKVFIIFGFVRFYNHRAVIKTSEIFYPINSIRSQAVLYGNSTISILFLCINVYIILNPSTRALNKILFQSMLTIFIPLSALITIINSVIIRTLTNRLNFLSEIINDLKQEHTPALSLKVEPSVIEEFKLIESYLRKNLVDLEARRKRDRYLSEISAKTAHDIRSPLSVLGILSYELEPHLSEKNRALFSQALTRIQACANDFLQEYRTLLSGQSRNTQLFQRVRIDEILQKTLSEKKLQYHNKHISFEYTTEPGARFLFVKLPVHDFERLLSNILNNAVEAGAQHIMIQVLGKEEESCIIRIQDDGSGMSKQTISRILRGEMKSTKPSGSGIGLKTAVSAIQAWGGTFSIDSRLARGTVLSIRLPLADAPRWFAGSAISLPIGGNVVIFDDDLHYHTLLIQKMKLFQRKKKGIQIYTCLKEEKFTRYLTLPRDQTVFFIDYEIQGASQNGLEIITANQLMSHAFLVTNRDQDESLQQQCTAQGVKMLPKSLLDDVHFSLI